MSLHWLIINTEAFSGTGIKEQKALDLSFLPKVLLMFLKAFDYPFIILDESSKIKTNTPMGEQKKSSRCRLIKTLSSVGERAIMTGTLKSKSPLNVYDQYAFLDPSILPENMYEFAERYCIMETIRVGRGRRVIMGVKDYDRIRKRMVNAYARGGDAQLQASKASIFRESVVSEENLDWIMRHKEYTPFIHQDELNRRIAPYTMTVKREDVFDTRFERFVEHPIVRYADADSEQVRLMRELVELGFTDDFILGRVPALELLHRLQDVCNGFEPICEMIGDEKRVVSFRSLKESPKLEALMELVDEIDPDENQIAIFSARTNFTEAIKARLEKEGITFAHYFDENKAQAEAEFTAGKAQVFLSNLQPSAYGLNCLSRCNYAIYACSDYRAETFYQSKHRLLRGQLTAPKFAYHIAIRKSVEERLIKSLEAGMDLINDRNEKSTFMIGG